MATPEAKIAYRRRKELAEPTFGIMKEQLGFRRVLLRGLDDIKAEVIMVATAFNLRSLYRIWHRRWKSTWEAGFAGVCDFVSGLFFEFITYGNRKISEKRAINR